jgi:hypothetical protein
MQAVTGTVMVSITDANDNAPLFSTDTHIFTVTKSTPVGTHLRTLSVIDSDITEPNKRLSFSLMQDKLYFALSSSGDVTLAGDLDNENVGSVLMANVTVSLPKTTNILKVILYSLYRSVVNAAV